MDPVDPAEWGRRQAARAPDWSEAKWRRIAQILGVTFLRDQPSQRRDARDDVDRQPRTGEAA